MWKLIVLVNDDTATTMRRKRIPDELVEGDIEHVKLMLALQDFTHVREMYIQNMDPDPSGDPVDVYRVSKYQGHVDFIPWSFDIAQLAKCFPDPRDQALLKKWQIRLVLHK